MREATITPQEAVEILRDCGMKIGTEALREGLLQGAFPFGTAIRLQTVRCWVYPKKLEEWISEYRDEYKELCTYLEGRETDA